MEEATMKRISRVCRLISAIALIVIIYKCF